MGFSQSEYPPPSVHLASLSRIRPFFFGHGFGWRRLFFFHRGVPPFSGVLFWCPLRFFPIFRAPPTESVSPQSPLALFRARKLLKNARFSFPLPESRLMPPLYLGFSPPPCLPNPPPPFGPEDPCLLFLSSVLATRNVAPCAVRPPVELPLPPSTIAM